MSDGFRIPAGRRVPDRERDARRFPRLGCRHRLESGFRATRICFEQLDGRGIGRAAETRRDAHHPDREPVEQVGQAVVVVLIGVAQEDRVDPADAALPERRRDDPATDGRITQPPAVVEKVWPSGVWISTARPCPTARNSALIGGRGRRRVRAASSQPGTTQAASSHARDRPERAATR